jgi:hypothetical protein
MTFSRFNLDTITMADYCTAMQDAIKIALEGSSDFINVILWRLALLVGETAVL